MLLCDNVQQHDDRRIDIIGIVSDVLFTNLQEQMPLSELSATLVVGLHSNERFRTYGLRVTEKRKGKSETVILDSQIGFVDGEYSPVKTQRIDINFLRTATNEVLQELGLADRVSIRIIQPEIDSDHYGVGLTERTGPATSKYPHFRADPAEALNAVQGGRITVESLKPLVLREVLKIFPEVAAVA